jgi:hypothetical protein
LLTNVLLAAAFAVVAVVFASVVEWLFHKYVLHRPVFGFLRFAFVSHALVHHKQFRHDDTYHISKEEYSDNVGFAWWHGIVLVVLGAIPFAIAAVALGRPWLTIVPIPIFYAYVMLFEYLHTIMHVPANRWVERRAFFIYLKEHHRLHHHRYGKNLNVVLPLADLLLGTRYYPPKPARELPDEDGACTFGKTTPGVGAVVSVGS